MQKCLTIALASAAITAVTTLGAAAQSAAAAPPPLPLSVITEAAHVDKAKVGGGECDTAGILQSDKGGLNTTSYMIECSHRDKAGIPETHGADETEAFYIMKGTATFIYGGKIVGKTLVGGTTVHLAPGDVEVIPGGLPHWFAEVPTQVSYLLFRRKG